MITVLTLKLPANEAYVTRLLQCVGL